MTPQQLRALKTLERLGERLTPALQAAYMKALEKLRLSADLNAAVDALERGDTAGAVRALLPSDATAQFTHDLTAAVSRVMGEVGPEQAREIAAIVRVDFEYVPGSPAAADALATLVSSGVFPVVEQIGTGLLAILTEGLKAGQNPRVVARLARAFIGLGEHDAGMVASFVQQLRTDPAVALTRALRDGRYDRTVAGSIDGVELADAQIAVMEEAYTRRLIAFRAETIARTTTLSAIRVTQAAAWNQIADDLKIDRDRIVKTWITTLDGRERPTHHELHGTTLPMDQPYPNGNMTVGDGIGDPDWNCRCVEVVRLLPANASQAADFLAQRQSEFAAARTTKGRQPRTRKAA